MKRVIRSDCLPQRQKVPLCLPLRRPVNPSVHYVHPSWTAFGNNEIMFIVILFQMNFYENSIRIIGKILENNWGEILEFQSRIIGREKRIMCRPLMLGTGEALCMCLHELYLSRTSTECASWA